jgi:2-dehydropantoate 2-reductase
MKIAIAGAGAMGSRFGLMLKNAGNEVLLIDGWQAHIDAIKESGLRGVFNNQEINVKIPIVHQKKVPSTQEFDLIILFTKAMQLKGMLEDIKGIIGNNTRVLCLLNGIGHEDIIEKYVPVENIFIGNTMWTAELVTPGVLKLFGDGFVDLQNLGENQEEAAKTIAKVMSEAGLNTHYSENIRQSIYKKACVNGTMNGLCTLLESNVTTFGNTRTADEICQAIVSEFAAVALKEGIHIDVNERLDYIKSGYNPETIGLHYPSMYQDLINNHRLTEIDYINGVISRKGKKYDVPTPYNDFLTALIHAKEDILGAK